MREIRPSGSEGGGSEINRSSLPLSMRGEKRARIHLHFFSRSQASLQAAKRMREPMR